MARPRKVITELCMLCSKPAEARGLCMMHYQKARRTGTLERVGAPVQPGYTAYWKRRRASIATDEAMKVLGEDTPL
jgi:hypothetical protein